MAVVRRSPGFTQNSLMDVAAKEFRISVLGLERGMFVARLDRPWLGTGFALEGVAVRTDDEVHDPTDMSMWASALARASTVSQIVVLVLRYLSRTPDPARTRTIRRTRTNGSPFFSCGDSCGRLGDPSYQAIHSA